ncbi:IclR family transcriptional regulator [Niveispirillum sp.]|uniref:IclR family transcriptional regulator n=1 Tax=Niveispirillum sp. TaxID=1917217 RepID=UPI001B5DED50|nr:IclR family transcriptional regulator [Niveispirillum sp.]MBP7340560.1 IclR family transcriptional regulator [Niveispirillum sp.]
MSSTTDDHDDAAPKAAPSGSQTLLRGLDVLEAVAEGPINLAKLAQRLDLTRSTTHRLAAALVERDFLILTPREGYQLGPKLLELGYLAQQQMDIPRVARPYIEDLAAATEDTVHLGVLDGEEALYLDKIPGRRRIEIGSRVGERHPIASTGLGKALILDESEFRWRRFFDKRFGEADWPVWQQRMRGYVEGGYTFDLEENEDRIRCVAAPIRGANGKIIAAISLSSAAQYMSDERMQELITTVKDTARSISKGMGWSATLGRR